MICLAAFAPNDLDRYQRSDPVVGPDLRRPLDHVIGRERYSKPALPRPGAPILIRTVLLGGSLAGKVSSRLSSIWSKPSLASRLRARAEWRRRAKAS